MDKTPLNMWAVPKGLDALLYPFGMQGSNPNLDSPRLELVFEKGIVRASCKIHTQAGW